MASYKITIWNSDTLTKGKEVVRRTRPSAAKAAWKLTYEVLKSFAKLDTSAGWDAYHTIVKWDDLLPIGQSRSYTISNTGLSITMERTA
jgi:hypothetical protein